MFTYYIFFTSSCFSFFIPYSRTIFFTFKISSTTLCILIRAPSYPEVIIALLWTRCSPSLVVTMEQAFFDQEHVILNHGKVPIIYTDSRLFPDLPLYSEGMLRPLCRGWFHGISCVFLVGAWAILIRDCNESVAGQVASTLYILANLICYGTSSVYHIVNLRPKYEIWIQKMDHCGIPIMSVGTMIPVAVFLLGPFHGTFMIGVSLFFCIITCVNIFKNRPSITMQMLTAVWWFVPYWYPLYHTMTAFEFSCMLTTILSKAIGVLVFSYEYPDPCPTVFGYHEIFHIFVILGGLCIFLCNWSIIHRYCSVTYVYY